MLQLIVNPEIRKGSDLDNTSASISEAPSLNTRWIAFRAVDLYSSTKKSSGFICAISSVEYPEMVSRLKFHRRSLPSRLNRQNVPGRLAIAKSRKARSFANLSSLCLRSLKSRCMSPIAINTITAEKALPMTKRGRKSLNS